MNGKLYTNSATDHTKSLIFNENTKVGNQSTIY